MGQTDRRTDGQADEQTDTRPSHKPCSAYYASNAIYSTQPFNGVFSRTTWVSRYQKGKTSLDLNKARDNGVWGCSGISWTICKQSAPRFRQIATPTPHHSIFTGRMLFLTPNQQCQSTEGNNAIYRLYTIVASCQRGKPIIDGTSIKSQLP